MQQFRFIVDVVFIFLQKNNRLGKIIGAHENIHILLELNLIFRSFQKYFHELQLFYFGSDVFLVSCFEFLENTGGLEIFL